uniref:Uncharacterized protein n=1 Tax=Romanomermis culicivorax TaxID=13658 RepID=A0A915L4Q1_ROMCU
MTSVVLSPTLTVVKFGSAMLAKRDASSKSSSVNSRTIFMRRRFHKNPLNSRPGFVCLRWNLNSRFPRHATTVQKKAAWFRRHQRGFEDIRWTLVILILNDMKKVPQWRT